MCVKNSNPPIENCEVYSDGSTCSKCFNKFYKSGNTCLEVDNIPNCDEYDRTVKKKCLKCNDTHYLSGTDCEERKVTISDCK